MKNELDITIVKESLKCEICDKTFNTMQGLRSHKTKIHKGDILEKNYSSKCKECDDQFETKRKYKLIQKVLKHKEGCSKAKSLNKNDCKSDHKTGSCEVCGFIAKSEPNIKRHLRDKHGVMSVSTSPPPKKTKVVVEDKFLNDSEKMEIDSKEINVDEPDAEHEEMEVDSIEKQLSLRMDEKVIAKAKKIEEEEISYANKRKHKELRDKEIEKQEEEDLKKITKQNKQKVKNEKKKMRKKSMKAEKIDINKIPNIMMVRDDVSHLVNKGDKIYVVPGDGSCGPNSAAAFLFGDEVFGRQLKQKMNKFMGHHWEKKYKYKTGCSEESPFIRKLGGGGEVVFTDPEKLKEYLINSTEAELMWSDSEDLSIISDLFQVKIKVITRTRRGNGDPTVNWIHPDEEMKEHADLKHVDMVEMVLIHDDDSHFNLIVAKDSDLATKGSLSFRANIGRFIENNDKEVAEMMDKQPNKETEDLEIKNEIKNLKNELKKSNEKIDFLNEDYIKCEKEDGRG